MKNQPRRRGHATGEPDSWDQPGDRSRTPFCHTTMNGQIPEFATSEWYSDPTDHRCPHDAWLELFEVREPSAGSRNELRRTVIVVRLLGSYHDGYILLTYDGVVGFTSGSRDSGEGLGDWLKDSFRLSGDGLVVHRVDLARGSWTIEAESIGYEWIPILG